MEIIYKTGNLLDAQTDVIAHQVNCQGVMGSGVAKYIREKWPNVFNTYKEYLKLSDWDKPFYANSNALGKCLMVDVSCGFGKWIANLFGQDFYGLDRRYTNYEALYISLESLKEQMEQEILVSVAFPYKMSSDRGGADWNVVLAMIESVFKDTDITIEIWSLNGYTGCN